MNDDHNYMGFGALRHKADEGKEISDFKDAGCTPRTTSPLPISYSVYLRRLGSGTLGEVVSNLAALRALGISRLHISPVYPQTIGIFETTLNDHGYWPSNHEAVGLEIGGEEGFVTLLNEAGKHGIELVFDLVLSHFGYGLELSDRQLSLGLRIPESFRICEEIKPGANIDTAWTHQEILALSRSYSSFSPFKLPTLDQHRPEAKTYAREAYSKFIGLGVRSFRIDSARHMTIEYICDVVNEIVSAISGSRPTFFLEDNSDSYIYLRSRMYEIFRRCPTEQIYFFDFPLAGAILSLCGGSFDFRSFMNFIHEREESFNHLERFVPFVENHDSTRRVQSYDDCLISNVLAEFFSYNSLMVYHGGESYREAQSSRFELPNVDHSGPIADALKAVRSLLAKPSMTSYTCDTTEHLVENWRCIVSKEFDGEVVILTINKSSAIAASQIVTRRAISDIEALTLKGESCVLEVTSRPHGILINVPPGTIAVIRVQLTSSNIPRTVSAQSNVHVLMTAMEFECVHGLENIRGEPLSIKTGGLGQVVGELITEAPGFFSARNAKVSFLFPLYGGIARKNLNYAFSLNVSISGVAHTVKIYSAADDNNIYLADHPSIRRRSCMRPPSDGGIYGFPNDIAGECEFLALMNQTISGVAEQIQCGILHSHDYQTALASAYSHNLKAAVVSIHNAGSEMPVEFTMPVYSGLAKGKITRKGWRMDTEKFSTITGIHKGVLDLYFQRKGGIDLLRGALSYNYDRYGTQGATVSAAYADELKLSWIEHVGRIVSETSQAPKDPFSIFLPNGGTPFHGLVGIDNGSSFRTARRWRSSGEQSQKKYKTAAKRLILQRYFAAIDNSPPLFCLLTRLTAQKNVEAILTAAETATKFGAYFLLCGVPDQSVTPEQMTALACLRESSSGKFIFLPKFISGIRRHVLMAATDYTFIPSVYEPFGLTDIEFSRYGAVIIARKTGGLSKLSATITYDWADTSDKHGEHEEVARVIKGVLSNKIIGQMADGRADVEFPWSQTLGKYWELYGL